MYKTLITLLRGKSHTIAEATTDAHAITILRQQMRDAATGLEKSKRAVALAMSYREREKKTLIQVNQQITSLEGRAIDAMNKGEDVAAAEAAEAIANLEAERDNIEAAIAKFDQDIASLRSKIKNAESRMRALKRGTRLADATEKTQHLRGTQDSGVVANLQNAEKTLDRLQGQQEDNDFVERAIEEMSVEGCGAATDDKLANAGFGKPLKNSADDVLERLRKSTKKPTPKTSK